MRENSQSKVYLTPKELQRLTQVHWSLAVEAAEKGADHKYGSQGIQVNADEFKDYVSKRLKEKLNEVGTESFIQDVLTTQLSNGFKLIAKYKIASPTEYSVDAVARVLASQHITSPEQMASIVLAFFAERSQSSPQQTSNFFNRLKSTK